MRLVYLNDTGRDISVHLATSIGIETDRSIIKPLEEREFKLPKNTYPWVKMWDYQKHGGGLQILVIAKELD